MLFILSIQLWFLHKVNYELQKFLKENLTQVQKSTVDLN